MSVYCHDLTCHSIVIQMSLFRKSHHLAQLPNRVHRESERAALTRLYAEELYRIIESFCLSKRRIELFGDERNIRPGWWGDETSESV
jgi:N6-adenosine-specific RNA methylase IME4